MTTVNNGNDKSSREKYLDFLREQVNIYKTFQRGNQSLDENELKDIFKMMKNLKFEKDIKNHSFLEITEDYIKKLYYPAFGETYMLKNISKNIRSQSEEIINEYEHSDNVLGDIIEAGWDGIFNYNVERLIENSSFCLDVEFALPEETNMENVSITNLFGNSYYGPVNDCNFDENILKNALVYLIHQQGYSIKDVLDEIIADVDYDYDKKPKFVESISREVINNPNYNTILTACIKIEGFDICNFFDSIFKEENYLWIYPSVRMGLFNKDDGGGSLFEINIDKPFFIPFKYIEDVIIENAYCGDTYPVSEVYGIGDKRFWKKKIAITTEPFEKVETKYEIDEYIKKTIKGEE